MNISYEVRYRYYQYNDGRSNNGTYDSSVVVNSKDKAVELARRINESALAHKQEKYDDMDYELMDELIPCGGYLISAKVYEVQKSSIEI